MTYIWILIVASIVVAIIAALEMTRSTEKPTKQDNREECDKVYEFLKEKKMLTKYKYNARRVYLHGYWVNKENEDDFVPIPLAFDAYKLSGKEQNIWEDLHAEYLENY